MTELDDHELLAEYARTQSEAAFAGLVARYVHLVYSAAARYTGNPHHAEEITQAVFLILAGKAGSLGRNVVLSGWLYQTARLTAANFVKGEIRRQHREQEAYMQSTLKEPESPAWRQIAPLLEEAMGSLGEADRNAVVLRYFENKTAREVAVALKLKEAAAHKRVQRAVEKLRRFFLKRGLALSGVALAGAVSANSVSAAPPGLAATISATAIKGTLLSTTLTTLVKGTLKIMTYTKLKLALAVTAGILLAGGATTLAVWKMGPHHPPTPPDSPLARETIKKSQTAYAALSSYSDSGTVVSQLGATSQTTTFNLRLQRPNRYRIEWAQANDYLTNGGVVWSSGNGDYMVMAHGQANVQPTKYPTMETALGGATGVSGGAAATLPGLFFNQNWGGTLKALASGQTHLTQLPDEPVAGVDCYVVSGTVAPADLPNQGKLPDNLGKIGATTTTLWIGREDYLIHQAKTLMQGSTIKIPQFNDAMIRGMLRQPGATVTPEAIAARKKLLAAVSQQAQSMIASGNIIFTETHENIEVNQNFSPQDFVR
jgi:RNA polymerase sigma factor (sigma-70 family)